MCGQFVGERLVPLGGLSRRVRAASPREWSAPRIQSVRRVRRRQRNAATQACRVGVGSNPALPAEASPSLVPSYPIAPRLAFRCDRLGDGGPLPLCRLLGLAASPALEPARPHAVRTYGCARICHAFRIASRRQRGKDAFASAAGDLATGGRAKNQPRGQTVLRIGLFRPSSRRRGGTTRPCWDWNTQPR